MSPKARANRTTAAGLALLATRSEDGADLAEVLRNAIVDGSLPAGARLRQPQLARDFGVSRTPVREALHKLNAWGLVDLVVNQAAVVRRLGRKQYVGVFVVWSELAALAAELATPNIGLIEDRLEASLSDGRSVVEATTGRTRPKDLQPWRDRWVRGHVEFHAALLDAAESPLLSECIAATTTLIPAEVLWQGVAERPYPTRQSAQRREAVVEALRRAQPDEASEETRAYIQGLGDAFLVWRDSASASEVEE